MKEITAQFLAKAARAITTAEQVLESGDAEAAVARAYYAMFYAAEALLNERGLQFKKHGGVHGAFGEYFAKTGVLDPKYHRWLLEAFDQRIIADYGVEEPIGAEVVRTVIQRAREFLQAARQHLSAV